jgi:hypothetical protein
MSTVSVQSAISGEPARGVAEIGFLSIEAATFCSAADAVAGKSRINAQATITPRTRMGDPQTQQTHALIKSSRKILFRNFNVN